MKELLMDFNWGEIATYALPLVALFAGGIVATLKVKLKAIIALLTAFSNAIEDDSINANERQDLVEKAKELLGK